jgi:hypothetical protein
MDSVSIDVFFIDRVATLLNGDVRQATSTITRSQPTALQRLLPFDANRRTHPA